MAKQTTETGKTLVPASHYDAMITGVKRKEIKGGYIIYEWNFEALVDGQTFQFTISLFSSQMTELLKAIGAKEVSANKFEWDDESVVGLTLGFNLVHVEDKKGNIREQLSDIKLLSPLVSASDPKDVQWGN